VFLRETSSSNQFWRSHQRVAWSRGIWIRLMVYQLFQQCLWHVARLDGSSGFFWSLLWRRIVSNAMKVGSTSRSAIRIGNRKTQKVGEKSVLDRDFEVGQKSFQDFVEISAAAMDLCKMENWRDHKMGTPTAESIQNIFPITQTGHSSFLINAVFGIGCCRQR
jgi:hypothetical protein